MGPDEEKLEEGLPSKPATGALEGRAAPIVSFREEKSGTPTLHQLESLASNFKHPDGKGPFGEFVKEAESLQLPADYALSLWAFVATSLIATRTLHSIFGVEQRLNPAFLFAGDEIGVSRLLRDIGFEVLAECDYSKTISSVHMAQTKEGLELFKRYDSLNVVDSGPGLDLKTWTRAPKGQIPLELLFDGVRLDRYLKTFARAADDVPAGVSVLAGCGVNDLLAASPDAKRLFGSFLVVPSLGCSGRQAYSGGELKSLRNHLLRLLPLSKIPQCELRMSTAASEKWKEMLTTLKSLLTIRESVGNEESPWHYRQVSTPRNWIVLSLAHAIHRTFFYKLGFTGMLEPADLEFAHTNLDLNHRAWEQTEDTYEKSQHVEEALWYLRLIQDDFAKNYSPEDGGITVGFGALRQKYCHHPGRDSKYSSREFHIHVLGELQRRGLAAPHPKTSRTWIFSKNMDLLKVPPKMAASIA
ncbi:hypothetical protein QEH59_11700 [Coraliomargarita sp. SDUM461004]|uniref:Uncharacterized protein n=1 Tax=Thalassobacterium sedimentorum TaxID=3041258 RepID=A0ABU1ALK9_9BACT|nr:hypothetical protein [Coraliomargarita sp. SDUM461004]MDQ8195093.1 hypothetical protein [Coraliomargarita sp. SDUM461004]